MINRVLTKINGFVTLGAVHHLVGSIATVPHSTTSTELNSEGGYTQTVMLMTRCKIKTIKLFGGGTGCRLNVSFNK